MQRWGTVGLGVSKEIEKLEWPFCLIPLVCAYIDALCLHLNLRIYSIGQWHKLDLGKDQSNEFEYMKYYERFTSLAHDRGAYNLEKWTIFLSSICIYIFVMLIPALKLENFSVVNKEVVFAFGVFGLVSTFVLNTYLMVTKNAIGKISSEDVLKELEGKISNK